MKESTEIDALLEISEAITSDLYLDEVLRLIVTVTAEVMNSEICSLMLLDEKRQELVIRSTQSVSEVYTRKPNIKLGQGIVGRVAQQNRPIMVEDVKRDNRYINQEIARKEGLCSLLSVPLSTKGKVVGVFNCYTSTLHQFTAKEIAFLQTIAAEAAVVIENAELLTTTKIIREQLETRKIVEQAKKILIEEEGINEEEAHRRIQRHSMQSNRAMRQIAEAILLTSRL